MVPAYDSAVPTLWLVPNSKPILGEHMTLKTKIVVGLIAFAIFDIVIPIPITALFLLYVLLNKPPWFLEWVREAYQW